MSAYGITLTVLATGLAEAVAKDELPDNGGFDLSAGLFGQNVSAWLRSVAEELAAAQAREQLLRSTLEKIANWNQHSVEFAADVGSVGVRDMYRGIAYATLALHDEAVREKNHDDQ